MKNSDGLSDCGLVSSRKDGKWQHYSINCERFAEYKEYMKKWQK